MKFICGGNVNQRMVFDAEIGDQFIIISKRWDGLEGNARFHSGQIWTWIGDKLRNDLCDVESSRLDAGRSFGPLLERYNEKPLDIKEYL